MNKIKLKKIVTAARKKGYNIGYCKAYYKANSEKLKKYAKEQYEREKAARDMYGLIRYYSDK